ncbi:MAG: DUF3857 domain-containing protein [Muribaculum sp.]|nr:DUF3857 domain-containing protein [Muribaculum sp.]
MKPFRHIIPSLIAAICTIMSIQDAHAAADEKFFKKAAEIVWSVDLAEFDPNADLSDSIFADCSAVRIAYMRNIVAGLENNVSLTKYLNTGKVATSATSAIEITRVMIKLNDRKAIEEFSDFDFDAKYNEGSSTYSYVSLNTAFGARIYKPDGTINNVDISEAYTLTTGKKGNASKHRIAIPGLSPGDVLEYFFYTETYLDEMSLPPITIPLTNRYPTKSYILECNVSEDLTLEYMPFNGAPALSHVPSGNKKQAGIGFKLENIEAFDLSIPYFSLSRQVPFIKMYIMNNNSNLVYHPQSARIGGTRIPTFDMIISDIACSIVETSLPPQALNKAASYVKQWKKAHPEATEREIIDAAWLATTYAVTVDERRFSDRALSVYFTDVLKKAGVATTGHIGVTSSRQDVPVSRMIHYNSPRYFVQVGDSNYMISSCNAFLPGEISGYYAGEEAFKFAAKRDHKFYPKSLQKIKLPVTKASANNANVKINFSLTEDFDTANVECNATLTGAYKQSFSHILDDTDRLEAIEKYLGIDIKERNGRYAPDESKRQDFRKRVIKSAGETLLGSTITDMSSCAVTSPGCIPGEPGLAFSLKGNLEGLVSRAGNNLVVKIGSLIGRQREIKESHRTREVDILRRSPDNTRIDIAFRMPDGYTVSEESLQSLCRNISNAGGTFFTRANIDAADPSTVILNVNIRNPKTHYPASAWEDILALEDAAVDFTTASLVLTPAGASD